MGIRGRDIVSTISQAEPGKFRASSLCIDWVAGGRLTIVSRCSVLSNRILCACRDEAVFDVHRFGDRSLGDINHVIRLLTFCKYFGIP